jgi:hypothetical protein
VQMQMSETDGHGSHAKQWLSLASPPVTGKH